MNDEQLAIYFPNSYGSEKTNEELAINIEQY
jgi:hypothetical protein